MASEQLDPYFRNLILQAGFCSLFVFVSLSSLMNFTVKLTKPWTFEIFQEWPITADIRMCEFSTKWQTNLSFFACGLVFACLIIKIFFFLQHMLQKYFWCLQVCWFDSKNIKTRLYLLNLVGHMNFCRKKNVHRETTSSFLLGSEIY